MVERRMGEECPRFKNSEFMWQEFYLYNENKSVPDLEAVFSIDWSDVEK